MRLLLVLLPFLVTPMSVFPAGNCDSRLSAPVQSAIHVLEQAITQRVLTADQIAAAFAGGQWRNPFTLYSRHLTTGQFQNAFANISAEMTAEQQTQFREALARLLAKNGQRRLEVERARAETAELVLPHEIDRPEMAKVARSFEQLNCLAAVNGRPALVRRYIETNGSHVDALYDPFNPDSKLRYRKFPAKHTNQATYFHFGGRDFLLWPVEQLVLDLETWQEAKENFNLKARAPRSPSRLHEYVMFETQADLEFVGAYNGTPVANDFKIIGVSLADPKAEAKVYSTKGLVLSGSFNLAVNEVAGRQVMSLRTDSLIRVWDGKSGQQFPDLAAPGEAAFAVRPIAFELDGDLRMAVSAFYPDDHQAILVYSLRTGKVVDQLQNSTQDGLSLVLSDGEPWAYTTAVDDVRTINLRTMKWNHLSGFTVGAWPAVFHFKGTGYTLSGRFGGGLAYGAVGSSQAVLINSDEKADIKTFTYKEVPYAFITDANGIPALWRLIAEPK